MVFEGLFFMEDKMEMRHYILLPDSAAAMKLYALMDKKGVACTPAPTPRAADHCCGISILYEDAALQPLIRQLAGEAGITVDAFWECRNTDNPHRMKFC